MKTKTSGFGRVLAVAVALFTAAVPAHAADDATVAKGSSIKGNDKEFFEKAAKSGDKEIAVSQAVYARLANAGIRTFAEKMVADHTAAGNELKALASKKGVTLPTLDPKVAQKWSDENDDLDEKYIEEMVSDHKEAVSLFEKATTSSDPEIAAFAKETLPKLQHHLDQAEALEKSVD